VEWQAHAPHLVERPHNLDATRNLKVKLGVILGRRREDGRRSRREARQVV
jgi:hypothetical protein